MGGWKHLIWCSQYLSMKPLGVFLFSFLLFFLMCFLVGICLLFVLFCNLFLLWVFFLMAVNLILTKC